MKKRLDLKLAEIRTNPNSKAFIIAYAADADMSAGIPTTGGYYPPRPDHPHPYPSIQEYYEQLEAIIRQGKIEILLASVSTMDILAREKHLFQNSPLTPAIRANDTTDIWGARGSNYRAQLSRPFATTTIEEAQYGTLTPDPLQKPEVNLGLYSVTFNNNLEADLQSLERFKAFRVEATRKGFKYFLEVFNPNVADVGLSPEEIPHYVNDQIARMLAGVPRSSRPEFLKIAYNGPKAMEELVHYDSTLIIGILGGAATTTYDAFKLIAEAKKHGARLALFGRHIKASEHPLFFIEVLRRVADEEVTPEEGVKLYRGKLQELGIPPRRDLEADMVLASPGLLSGL